jgi:hypothetical protein
VYLQRALLDTAREGSLTFQFGLLGHCSAAIGVPGVPEAQAADTSGSPEPEEGG